QRVLGGPVAEQHHADVVSTAALELVGGPHHGLQIVGRSVGTRVDERVGAGCAEVGARVGAAERVEVDAVGDQSDLRTTDAALTDAIHVGVGQHDDRIGALVEQVGDGLQHGDLGPVVSS